VFNPNSPLIHDFINCFYELIKDPISLRDK